MDGHVVHGSKMINTAPRNNTSDFRYSAVHYHKSLYIAEIEPGSTSGGIVSTSNDAILRCIQVCQWDAFNNHDCDMNFTIFMMCIEAGAPFRTMSLILKRVEIDMQGSVLISNNTCYERFRNSICAFVQLYRQLCIFATKFDSDWKILNTDPKM